VFKLLACVLEVPTWNLGQNINYPERNFLDLTQYLQMNAMKITGIVFSPVL
jgi:hypothetical protein